MDQGAPARPAVSAEPPARPLPEHDGLAPHVAAVRAAREQLGRDLERLEVEVRAQMARTMEEVTWKVAAAGAAVLAGIVVRRLLFAGWRAARKADPPANPASRDVTWPEALAWAVATGAGVGVARLVAARGAAAGWQRATGLLPPGLQDVS